jgi:hypothetical protein
MIRDMFMATGRPKAGDSVALLEAYESRPDASIHRSARKPKIHIHGENHQ